MRLHHLSATAFGPFADTVRVDFDQLSEAGLFLLSGPTGAGKTSVLDAVAFALYGDVPGDRNAARALRSDQAAPGVAPLVVLEATLSGRRFRITRSPQWVRPKKRGSGSTTEQAHVVVEERIGGEWSPLSNRIDETGHLVTGLVGMNMAQFCQVAMLPQGQFQAFLRARSEERHQLLQQLFSTRRFQDIEQWLRDHARGLGRSSTELHRDAARLLDRVLEAGDASLPDGWSTDDLGLLVDDNLLQPWLTDQVDTVTAAATVAAEELAAATEAEAAARAAAEAGHRLATRQERHRRARKEQDRLDQEAPAHEARRTRLALARRAAPMAPLHRHAQATRHQAESAEETARLAWQAAVSALAADAAGTEGPDRDALVAAGRAARDRAALASALLAREPELDTLRTRLRVDEVERTRLSTEIDARSTECATLPDRIRETTTRLEAAKIAAVEVTGLERAAEQLTVRVEAARRLVAQRGQFETARARSQEATTESLALKERWLEVREQRIAGMAAELAHDLAVGASCPVCGSEEHPAKAVAAAGTPSAATEKALRKQLDDAELARTAAESAVHEASLTLAALEERVDGATLDDLTTAQDDLDQKLTAARGGATDAEALTTALTAQEAALHAAQEQLAAHRVALAAVTQRIATDTEALATATAERKAACGSHPDLTSLVRAETALAECHEGAVAARDRAADALRAADEASTALEDWLDEHGFDGVDQAVEALLPDAELSALEASTTAHERALDQVRAVLADPEVAAATESQAPDLAALDASVASAVGAREAVGARATLTARRQARLASLGEELSAALERWAPVRAAHVVAADLAAFAEGKSAENELRMRLSAYVLAWRLTQVVDAANERLVRMSDGRYTLEHTGQRGSKETRGGLSLRVLDEWSGESRDPVTLSGGETFVVSLALALGLADVVTQEAGGADLDTLFVDEGFGSLDADTLDDVMDTVDSLREGGRVVGVVSHVAEMRSRIPTRLVVSKNRTGSTLQVVQGEEHP